ncbi:MAG: hypothetical protein HC806_09370 [Anaerolineae bacterium]|nr:hypothetical protein [Anaerolineae bacterium]
MENKDYSTLTDVELLAEKKKLKNAKILHAALIGFLAGILIFGVVSWILSPKKQIGFFIPMLIPIAFIYGLVKNPKTNQELENTLRERHLN